MSTLNDPPADGGEPTAARRTSSDVSSDGGRPAPTALREPLSTIAFWSAIALPVLYVPLLAVGLGSVRDLVLFVGLFVLHLAALLAGRSHRTR